MKFKWQPLLYALLLVVGIVIGNFLNGGFRQIGNTGDLQKMAEILNYINKDYVDTVNTTSLVEHGIVKILEKLDPHTSYIPKKEIVLAHSQLEGNFEGVGIEFYIIKDTILVVAPISEGPAEKAGLLAGDKIIKVDTVPVSGIGVTNADVFKLLRGPKNSTVKVSVVRRHEPKILEFEITRNKIPTYSLDANYMIDDEKGFIKINRFSETTYDEFHNAIIALKAKGMNKLILDLRDNPGGYLDMAIKICDEFLGNNHLIVYTIGKDERFNGKQYATARGDFEQGELIILINQGSASASEIVSGAIQDNDRGLILGTRSFGKGLVQRPIALSDGSELRLTISRYYTPSGRSIQKPYNHNNIDEYNSEVINRFKKGEYFSADSINFNDSLKFKTLSGRTVYGGGGIMPDIFVPRDTSQYTTYILELFNKNIVREYALEYYAANKKTLSKIKLEDYTRKSIITEKMLREIIEIGKKEGIKFREREYRVSKNMLVNDLRAYLARSMYGNNGFYSILNMNDEIYKKAIKSFPLIKNLERNSNKK